MAGVGENFNRVVDSGRSETYSGGFSRHDTWEFRIIEVLRLWPCER